VRDVWHKKEQSGHRHVGQGCENDHHGNYSLSEQEEVNDEVECGRVDGLGRGGEEIWIVA
jgi:hypothetical protein